MKIEFTLKDRNGIELNEGDRVNWCCDNLSIEDCIVFGVVNKMYNSGEIIPGRLVFYKTSEEADNVYSSSPTSLELKFLSDNGKIRWSINCPSSQNDYRHVRLEKRKE